MSEMEMNMSGCTRSTQIETRGRAAHVNERPGDADDGIEPLGRLGRRRGEFVAPSAMHVDADAVDVLLELAGEEAGARKGGDA
jgi:hypothetical protein